MSFDWNVYDQDIEKLYHPENFEDPTNEELAEWEGGEDNE